MTDLKLNSSQSLNSNFIYDTLKSGADFISENHVTIISVFLLSLFVGAACAGFSGFGLLAFSGSMAVWTTLHAGSILGGLGALGGLTALCALGKMFFSRESAPQAQAESFGKMFFSRESAPQAQAESFHQMPPPAAPTESIPSQVESTPPSAVNPPVEKRCAEIINPGDENENLGEQWVEEFEQLAKEPDMEKRCAEIINPGDENENLGEQWVKEFDKDGKASIADETQDKSGQPKTVNETQSEEELFEAQKTRMQTLTKKRIDPLWRRLTFDHPQQKTSNNWPTIAARL